MTNTRQRRASDTKQSLIENIVSAASGKGPFESRQQLAEFIRQYYDNVAVEDLREPSADGLANATLSHLKLATTRKAESHKIRIYNPSLKNDGWESTHTIIELVNDDMPFLVDSVSMAIDRAGLGLHLTVHPLMRLQRNSRGRLTRILREDGQRGGIESLIRCEIDRISFRSTVSKLEEEIDSTLSDVRCAVKDWLQMREMMRDCAKDIDAADLPVDLTVASESSHLLDWMADNHFTFLGYHEYTPRETNDTLTLTPVADSGLGILSDDRHKSREMILSPAMRRHALSKDILIITKANSRSTIHRPNYLDYIGVKQFDAQGKPNGERRFLGLFTSVAYSESPRTIPLLRLKVHRVQQRSGLDPSGHRGKALAHILDTYPREELFQSSVADLARTTSAILNLQDRRQVRLFLRRDAFRRFFSCLVYVPRDKYNTGVRLQLERLLLDAFSGESVESNVEISNSDLARLHILVRTSPNNESRISIRRLERNIAQAVVTWQDRLRNELVARFGEEDGLDYFERYATIFPLAYEEDIDAPNAAIDVGKIHNFLAGEVDCQERLFLYRSDDAKSDSQLNFKTFTRGKPLALSDALPVLENLGVRVLNERPYELTPADGVPLWIQDFELNYPAAAEIDAAERAHEFAVCFDAAVTGHTENDGFNQLVLDPGLTALEIMIVRAYARYLVQLGLPFSQHYMETVFADHRRFARQFIDLFYARFDPALSRRTRARRSEKLEAGLRRSVEQAVTLDEDRILRAFVGALLVSLRTNYFQTSADGRHRPALAIKLKSEQLNEAPFPRPKFEIFVYSPRLEAVHLRAGSIARGGIRWSDRREDFRTEILGLMKAQTVKNTIIVPTGAKGGFVAKKLPRGDRAAVQDEVIACYKIFIGSLLDVTDNLVDEGVVSPKEVVKLDGDDPYLVVAADKGTASFSDIANELSTERGFWLDDAFASGGSAGYDHKKMGITARGTWEAVRRHFRELGLNTQTEEFTVVGIGDMGGDVFGNGMLLSKTIRLIAAFNHLHIFIDPDPDANTSFKERRRLFRLKGSSWADYDRTLISRGGGVFERAAKKISLSPEIRAALNIEEQALSPIELIRNILAAPVDLLWNGGIGTYVKADQESHTDAGDRSNDALRINASQLRARVVGEGGNLGLTQAGRVQYAVAGGKINTDFIDNSAGVDSSDREVNIKILLGLVERRKRLPRKSRNALLAKMTDDVAALVLRNNYLQTQSISMVEYKAGERLEEHTQFIRSLEGSGLLNRSLEGLPNEEEIEQRRRLRRGLTRPEFAVLLSYAKIDLYESLTDRQMTFSDYHLNELSEYFPPPLPRRYRELLEEHRLHREILATMITNSIVNRMGPGFVRRTFHEMDVPIATIVRAYAAARDVTKARELWKAIEALDNRIDATHQYEMMFEVARRLRHVTVWLVRQRGASATIDKLIGEFAAPLNKLYAALPNVLNGMTGDALEHSRMHYVDLGAPAELAEKMAAMAYTTTLMDICDVGGDKQLTRAAEVYFVLGSELKLDWLHARIDALRASGRWQAVARSTLRDATQESQRQISALLLRRDGRRAARDLVHDWITESSSGATEFAELLRDIQQGQQADYATLSVAVDRLRRLSN